jgi:hypothetical protein
MDDSVETKEKAGHGYNINVFKHLFDHFACHMCMTNCTERMMF